MGNQSWLVIRMQIDVRTKHIDVRYHWIRDVLNGGLLEIEKIHTDSNGSDMLTKALPSLKLDVCCDTAGLVNPSFT